MSERPPDTNTLRDEALAMLYKPEVPLSAMPELTARQNRPKGETERKGVLKRLYNSFHKAIQNHRLYSSDVTSLEFDPHQSKYTNKKI